MSAPPPANQPPPPPTAPGWTAYFNPEHQRYYFHHEETNKTTWENPIDNLGDNNNNDAAPAGGQGPTEQRQPRGGWDDDRGREGGYGNGGQQNGRDRPSGDTRYQSRGEYASYPPRQQQQQQQKGGPDVNVSGGRGGRSAPNDSRKLYLSSLSWSTTQADLREAFEKIGPVEDAVVVYQRDDPSRSRGFGFVTMASEAAAQEGIRMYDGRNFQGRTIHVRVSTRDSSGGGRSSFGQSDYARDSSGGGRSSFGQSDYARDSGGGGRRSFGQGDYARDSGSGGRPGHGEGDYARDRQGPGYGDGGRDDSIDRRPPPRQHSQGVDAFTMKNENTIFVGQLNFSTTSRSLGRAFEDLNIGKVVSAKVIYFPNDPTKSKGFGFVEFENSEPVQRAIDLMDRRKIDGREVIVKSRLERDGAKARFNHNPDRNLSRASSYDANDRRLPPSPKLNERAARSSRSRSRSPVPRP